MKLKMVKTDAATSSLLTVIGNHEHKHMPDSPGMMPLEASIINDHTENNITNLSSNDLSVVP